MWHPGVRLDDLHDGTPRGLVIDGRQVLVALVDGEAHAVADVCPHRGATLSEGVFRDGCVTCPSHLWRFSVTDGTKQGDPSMRIAAYDTRVIDGWVEIDLPPAPAVRSLRETLLAHARGETVA